MAGRPRSVSETKTERTIPYSQPVAPRTNGKTEGPTQEQIARRAYELFAARGGEHGHDVEDWLQAERELRIGRFN
jgi:hypothetical protein